MNGLKTPPDRSALPDHWDPDYEPTQAELEEPIILPGAEHATPEDIARALLRPSPPVDWPDPDDD